MEHENIILVNSEGDVIVSQFDSSLCNDKEYIKNLMESLDVGTYDHLNVNLPLVFKGIFDLIHIYENDDVKWLEYHYNRIDITDKNKTPALYVDQNNSVECTHNMMNLACEYGAIKCIKYLYSKGRPYDDNSASLCFRSPINNLVCLEYVASTNAPITKYTMALACARNNLICLQYLVTNNYDIGSLAMEDAIRNNSIDCIDYLCKQNEIATNQNIITTITYDRVEILKIFSKYGHSFGVKDMISARVTNKMACYNYLKSLKN